MTETTVSKSDSVRPAVRPARRAASARGRFRLRRPSNTLVAGIVAFAIQWVHGTAPAFVWDAAQYWGGASALIAGEGALVPGGLTTRGVFTAFIYLPPAFVTGLVGPESEVWTVLTWNALLGAAVSVVLVPRMAGLFSAEQLLRPPASRIWVSAVGGGLLLSGFARFPLVDVWATSLALAGVYGLVVCRRWWWLSVAGISLTVAVNLRPSMIAPVVLAVAVLLLVRAVPIAIAVPAAVFAIAPQVIFNVRNWGLWSPVPHDTIPLSAVQAGPAPYTLRYDTVAFADQAPQQWYCDPHYAKLLADDTRPGTQLEVVLSAFQHLPDSLWFLVRKAAINFQWSFETPYGNPPSQVPDPMAVLVVAVAVSGVLVLILGAFRFGSNRRTRVVIIAMLAFWFGGLATVVFSTPETRFALPMVMVGLIGLVSAVPERLAFRAPTRGELVTVGCGLLFAVALFLAGTEALGHERPPGPLTDAAACASRR